MKSIKMSSHNCDNNWYGFWYFCHDTIFFLNFIAQRYVIVSTASNNVYWTLVITFWFSLKNFIIDLWSNVISKVSKRVFKIVITTMIFRNQFFFSKNFVTFNNQRQLFIKNQFCRRIKIIQFIIIIINYFHDSII